MKKELLKIRASVLRHDLPLARSHSLQFVFYWTKGPSKEGCTEKNPSPAHHVPHPAHTALPSRLRKYSTQLWTMGFVLRLPGCRTEAFLTSFLGFFF